MAKLSNKAPQIKLLLFLGFLEVRGEARLEGDPIPFFSASQTELLACFKGKGVLNFCRAFLCTPEGRCTFFFFSFKLKQSFKNTISEQVPWVANENYDLAMAF